jgi:sugar-specific transcriptional regulator TrmB
MKEIEENLLGFGLSANDVKIVLALGATNTTEALDILADLASDES